MSDDLVEGLLDGAAQHLAGAADVVAVPNISRPALQLAFNGAADAINLAVKAYVRHLGYLPAENEAAPALVRRAGGPLHRGFGERVPSDRDLVAIILARNSSVHTGAASFTDREQAADAVELATTYLDIVRTAIGRGVR